ncbi:MAG: nucleotidyltransferase [Mesorhizobium sp.]|uniref:SMODS domain-containing nucleotidyltransferase n=1 Tax=Mesorhizobium sp. TaxID=1871066 RepID=UPI000FE646F5|nr:hypothetical protein [Mesorhizobium sp.]RWC29873.1 MAG: nucleotidyltransferase [Mesorhizobium sp.]
MWVAVRERFRRLVSDLQITQEEVNDGWTKHINVGRSLERAYYGQGSGDYPPSLLVGSWGKGTQVKPSNDIDSFFILPPVVKSRFDLRSGNVQSQLLQEVKSYLLATYPQTDIRGDGQVVVVNFNSITLELVPVFRHGAQFLIPDTRNEGSWRVADPIAQMSLIEDHDKAMNGNVRAVSKIIKLWCREKDVPLKSFIVELLVAEFLSLCGYGMYSTYWYDFYVRDFLNFLVQRADSYVFIPGTGEVYGLGRQWLPKAVAARDVAVQACDWEYSDYDVTAGQEWQKIFGSRIPIHVRM